MNDFFEIDFLNVESNKSGDAITIRYQKNNTIRIHVIDGGFQSLGPKIVEHINEYYDNPTFIDSVILTHPDGDHAGGLQTVLEEFDIGELWMLRPWEYVDELIHKFVRRTSKENLEKDLRQIYSTVDSLEKIALAKGITIKEPFQGEMIGDFTVMSPSKDRYLNLVADSDKTPESVKVAERTLLENLFTKTSSIITEAVNLVKAAWGEENFSPQETSAENEMSVVQYCELMTEKILLTGDTGRSGIRETIDYAPYIGLNLPGIDRFQVPHHGSRRNVNSELLNELLGNKLQSQTTTGNEHFTSIISASKKDSDHPRKAVIRAMIHRGGKVITNEEFGIRTGKNAPNRQGWGPVTPVEYPQKQED